MHRLRNFKIAAIEVIKYYIIGYVIRAVSSFSKINWLIYEGRSKKFQNKNFVLFCEKCVDTKYYFKSGMFNYEFVAWRKNTNKMQQNMIYCQFQMLTIDYSLDMFRASLCPSSGEKTTCYCIWGIFAGSVGCGRLRYCGATL